MKITPTKIQSLIVSLLLAFGLGAQAQLLNETFDSAAGFVITDGNDAVSPFFSDGFDDYFGIFDGDSDGGADFGAGSVPIGTESYTGFTDNYLVNEDMDADGTVIPYTLTWSTITLSGETFLEISADFASTRADSNDYIVVSYRVDGGPWNGILGVGGEGAINSTVFEITDFSGTVGDPSATALSIASTNISSTFALAGTETTLEIKAEFSNDNGTDNFGMDNLVVQVAVPPSVLPPTGLTAATAAFPSNKDSISVSFTPSGTDDVLIAYSADDVFGDPVNSTSYIANDTLIGGGTVLGVFSSAPATLAGLIPGQTVFFKAWSVDGSVEYSTATSSGSATTDTFALQLGSFSDWTAVDVSGDDSWFVNGNFASANGSDGTNPEEDWLISPALDLDLYASETFEFDYRSNLDDPLAVGLELFYTLNYTGDPTTTTWVAFSAVNSELDTNKSTGTQTAYTGTSVDLSAISGTTVSLAFKNVTGSADPAARDWDLLDPLISGNGASDEAITLLATPADVDEGAAITVTLSVPTNVGSDTDFFLSSNGDGSELTFPATVTILSGTNTVDFTVNGLTDSQLDGDSEIELIANRNSYTVGSLTVTVNNIDMPIPAGDIIFTQYYEGDTGNNKWVEISNVGATTITLTGYEVSLWRNANTEGWKVDGGTPDEILDLSSVTLAGGQTYLIANPDSTLPFAAASADTTSSITFFGGNDSILLYSDTTGYLAANVADAISFTNAGNEGSNKSYVRSIQSLGFDFDIGSSIEDYDDDNSGPAVWTEITIDDANTALSGEDAFIGSTALATAPALVSFSTGAQFVSEADGSFDLSIAVTGLTSGIVVVDVTFNGGSSTADAGDVTFSSPQQLTFDASSLVNPQIITVPIVDDGLDANIVEVASFDLTVSSGSILTGTPSTQNVSIQDIDVVVPPLIISEVTDPSDTANAKYVEIYNPGPGIVDLAADSWTLARFANANVIAGDIPLTGTIGVGETYIVANNATDFALYGSGPADLTSGTVSGNGDDTYALYFGGGSATGILVDVYGEAGTDGTGEAWEYLNSRAYRNTGEVTPSAVWNAAEWTIEAAAVADMTPGVHPEGGDGPVLPTYPITEDFSGTSTWVNQTVSGSFPWQIDGVDERAEADGFADGASTENHYLVSPAFNFTSVTDITLAFDYGENFDGPDLELLYSTNYSGSGDPEAGGVVWTPISFVFTDSSTGGGFSASSSGDIALSVTLEGLTDVYIAFKYTADGTEIASEQWFVDNIVVDATSAAPDPLADYLAFRDLAVGDLELDTNNNGFTVLEEYLSGFGDGVGSDVIEYGIDVDGTLALTLTNDLATIPDGIVVELLATSDLTLGFAPVAFTRTVVDNGDGTFTHSYTENAPPVSDARFLQLRITEASLL